MDVHRIAAFSQADTGGNPAGVVLSNAAMPVAEMARIALEVGYSETAFAFPMDNDNRHWRVRYFAPESEVPFCGHATIALGAELGRRFGTGTFALTLNDADITVDASQSDNTMTATLTSPPTRSRPANEEELTDALDLFGLGKDELDLRLPPAHIHGGADHLLLALKSRKTLAAMNYDLAAGRTLMRRHGLVTIMLVYIEGDRIFSARNAFASGGVLEDPATGAAAAAFGGYLRDQRWPHEGQFTIRQGEDMRSPSLIHVALDDVSGAPVKVTGTTRTIREHSARP